MKVAIFPESEETFGFCKEGEKGWDWISEKYRVVEMTSAEVAELESTFKSFAQAQRKICELIHGYRATDDGSFAGDRSQFTERHDG